MNKMCKFAMVIGMGFALMNWAALAQNPTAGPEHPASEVADAPPQAASSAETAPAGIPPDQKPSKEQMVKLFDVMRLRNQMQDLAKMMPALVQKQIDTEIKDLSSKLPEGALTPDQQTVIAKVSNKYVQKAHSIIAMDELVDAMMAIYQRHMSRSDVDAFIAFYSSPAGQHLLDAKPAIMKEYMSVSSKLSEERSKGLMYELIKELNETVNSSVPPTDKPVQK